MSLSQRSIAWQDPAPIGVYYVMGSTMRFSEADVEAYLESIKQGRSDTLRTGGAGILGTARVPEADLAATEAAAGELDRCKSIISDISQNARGVCTMPEVRRSYWAQLPSEVKDTPVELSSTQSCSMQTLRPHRRGRLLLGD